MRGLLLAALMSSACGVHDVELSPARGEVILLDGLPASTPQRFASAQQGDMRDATLTLLYPEDGAALPANFPPLSFSYNDAKKMGPGKEPMAAAERVFELLLSMPDRRLRIYTTQLQATLAAARWQALLQNAEGLELTVQLSALDADNKVRVGKPVHVRVASPVADGRYYYWSETHRSLERTTLDGATQDVLANEQAVACAGCWAVSSDGRDLLQINALGAQLRADGDGALTTVDATTVASKVDDCSLAPDGQHASILGDGSVRVYELRGSDWLSLGQLSELTSFAWAPDAQHAAYVRRMATMMAPMMMASSAARLEQGRLGAAGELLEGVPLAPPTKTDEGLTHVAYALDGSTVAIERTKGPEGKDKSIALTTASGGELLALGMASKRDGWPSFVPARSADELWVLFSSGREGPLFKPAPEQTQLWLWNVQRLSDGTLQPASAPVWLPFQSADDVNVRPRWVQP